MLNVKKIFVESKTRSESSCHVRKLPPVFMQHTETAIMDVLQKAIQNLLNWWACDSGNSMPAMHRLRHVFLTTGRIPCVCCDAFYRLSEMCIWSMWNLGTTIEDISVYLPHSQRSFKHRGPFIPPSIKLSLLKHVNLESPMKKTKPFRQFPNFPLVHK